MSCNGRPYSLRRATFAMCTIIEARFLGIGSTSWVDNIRFREEILPPLVHCISEPSNACLTVSTERKLYWLDLNTSFPVDTAIPSNVLRSIAAPADSQWTGTGAFFTNADQTGLYSFGGFLYDDTEHNSTWLFNSSTAQWSNVTVSGGNLNKLNRDSSMHTSTTGTSQGLSFINGGWDSTSGMVVFNSDPHQLSWTNQTQNDIPGTMGSSMQFLRYGKAGVLIAFGGYDVSRYDTWVPRTQINRACRPHMPDRKFLGGPGMSGQWIG